MTTKLLESVAIGHAVVISFNFDTEQTMHTPFDGPNAGVEASQWVAKDSFLWDDFPESEGWTHVMACNAIAAANKSKHFLKSIGIDS